MLSDAIALLVGVHDWGNTNRSYWHFDHVWQAQQCSCIRH